MNRLKFLVVVVVGGVCVFALPMLVWDEDSLEGQTVQLGGTPTTAIAVPSTPQANGPDANRTSRGPAIKFVDVEGGRFLMGAQSADPDSPGYDPDAGNDEGPPRWVTVDSFSIQQREVSAAEYRRCISDSVCPEPSGNPSLSTVDSEVKMGLSMNLVSWTEATEYCAHIDARLPTEAEWEYAARGESGRRFPFGDHPICAVRAFKGEPSDVQNAGVQTSSKCSRIERLAMSVYEDHEVKALEELIVSSLDDVILNAICDRLYSMDEATNLSLLKEVKRQGSVKPLRDAVGVFDMASGLLSVSDAVPLPESDGVKNCAETKPPNPSDMVGHHPLQIQQMAGGMWEWVADFYAEQYVDGGSESNPTGPKTGTRRVQRGGGWMSSSPLDYRGAARASLPPDLRMPDVGFRCVRSL